ncbi:hypothetical protein F5Y07DRAFT_399409 [Xylaria sp. FL0933]|nr:hypothetical protein F5Y07DRAFT_399409 [Xylaria sp. FL0933]
MEVETLLPQLQDTLSQIKTTINELSSKEQDDELDQLEQKRDRLLADLEAAFQKEQQELEAKRQAELEDIRKKRKQEDEEIAARRRREDEELKKAKAKEDKKRQQKHDQEADSIEDETEQKMDEIEKLAQKKIEEGKRKIHELDEKRRELNRRIDEQLKESLPISPPRTPRKRDRSKKQTSDLPTNGVDGDSAPAAPQTDGSSPKTTNKPETPSKNQRPPTPSSPVRSAEGKKDGDKRDASSKNQRPPTPSSPAKSVEGKKDGDKPDSSSKHQKPPAPSSPERSQEGKKDGELPSQDRTIGPPQAAKTPAENLPRSFAEALRNDLSNKSKDKLESKKSSVDHAVQEQHIRNEFGSLIPNKSLGTVAHESGTEPTEDKHIVQEGASVQNTESSHDEKSGVRKAGDQGIGGLSHVFPSIFQLGRSNNEHSTISSTHKIAESNQETETNKGASVSGAQPEPAEKYEPIISNKRESRGESETQPRREHPHVLKIDKTTSENPTESTVVYKRPEKAERAPPKSHEAADKPKVEGPTVDSTSAVQSPRLPSTPDRRDPRQGDRTHDQVELGQSTVPNLPEQDRTGDNRASSEPLTRSRSSGRPSPAPRKPVFVAPPSPVQGHLVLSGLDRDVVDMPPPKDGNPLGFEHIQNSNSEFLHVLGPQAREKVGSPLPVENETVQGQDSLFDENKSVSDLSEPCTVEGGEPDASSPRTPVEGQGLPVILPEPPPKQDPCGQRLTSLIGEFDKWAILTEQITEHSHCQQFSSQSFPHQEHQQSYRLPVNPVLFPLVKTSSPARATSHEAKSGQSQSSSLNKLCNNILSGLVGPNPDSSLHGGAISDSEKSKHHNIHTEQQQHPERSRQQRGRPRRKSSQSPERALNPREQLFQSSDDEINIRSAWFRHSKRGLSS